MADSGHLARRGLEVCDRFRSAALALYCVGRAACAGLRPLYGQVQDPDRRQDGEFAAHIEDVSAGMYRGSVLPCGVGGRRIRHAGQGGFRVESVGALERSAVRAGTGLDRSDDRGAFAAFASGSVVAAAERVCAGQDRRVCAAGQMGALVRFAVCGDTVRVLRAGIQRRGVYLPGILVSDSVMTGFLS